MSHTPGPWKVVVESKDWLKSGLAIIDAPESGRSICRTYEVFGDKDPKENIANARLIAAAPELLELMKELRHAVYGLRTLSQLSESACQRVIEDTWYPKIDAIIAKAGGRE